MQVRQFADLPVEERAALEYLQQRNWPVLAGHQDRGSACQLAWPVTGGRAVSSGSPVMFASMVPARRIVQSDSRPKRERRA